MPRELLIGPFPLSIREEEQRELLNHFNAIDIEKVTKRNGRHARYHFIRCR